MGDFGWQELLIIFVILLLLFGATRLPALSKSLGQSIRGFKKGMGGRRAVEGEKPVASDKDKPRLLSSDRARRAKIAAARLVSRLDLRFWPA